MKSSLNDGSAKIYQFPVGGRAGLLGRRYGETPTPIDRATPLANETICSGSWYHEEAIQQSKYDSSKFGSSKRDSEFDAKPGWDH